MPREPRNSLALRDCSMCHKPFQPQVSPRGGQPPKRCNDCRPQVLAMRTGRDVSVPELAIAELLARTTRQSSVSAPIRERLLDVSHLLMAEAERAIDPSVLIACSAELRGICGFSSSASVENADVAQSAAINGISRRPNSLTKRRSQGA